MDVADLAHKVELMQADVSKNGTAIAAHIQSCKVRNEQQNATNSDHENRMRALERWQWKLTGMVLLASVVGSAVGPWLLTKAFG